MTNNMTFWGVGPKFGLYSAAYCILMVALSQHFDPFFKIHFFSYDMLATVAAVLIFLGIPFYIISIVTIKRAFTAGHLVTEKTFGMCRHPVYSAWIIFFVPAIMLLCNTWIGLTAPLMMYLLLLKLVKKEEVYLESVFGREYLAYKEMIPAVLPVGQFRSKA